MSLDFSAATELSLHALFQLYSDIEEQEGLEVKYLMCSYRIYRNLPEKWTTFNRCLAHTPNPIFF